MELLTRYKKIIIGIGVVVALFAVYSVFFKKEPATPLVSSGTPRAPEGGAGKEILTLLTDLRSIELNGDIFQSKAFRSLEDFSIPLELEPQGRPNPFAPIGKDDGTRNDKVKKSNEQ